MNVKCIEPFHLLIGCVTTGVFQEQILVCNIPRSGGCDYSDERKIDYDGVQYAFEETGDGFVEGNCIAQ